MLNRTDFYYFSPTGGTKKTGEILCQGLSEEIHPVDLGKRDQVAEIPESELVVVAVPVFGGRIPALAADKLKTLEGKRQLPWRYMVHVPMKMRCWN